MLLDKLPPRLDVVAHQHAEEFVGGAGVFHAHLEQRAVVGVERRFAELFRVHFAEALEAGDGEAFLARFADGGGEAAEVFESCFVFAAADVVAAPFFAGSLMRDEGLDREAEVLEVGENVVDRADFVEFDDAETRAFGFGVAVR